MKFYLVRGGDKHAGEIARRTGWTYGIRNDYVPYETPRMIDLNWKSYVFATYENMVRQHEPELAFVADFEHPSDITRVIEQYKALRPYTRAIGICVKCEFIELLPADAVIGISVPTSYAGYVPNMKKLNSRNCHLLGGSPKQQVKLAQAIMGAGGRVVSLDANYHVRKALQYGQVFSRGRWIQANTKHSETWQNMAITSGIAVKEWIENATIYQQLSMEVDCD